MPGRTAWEVALLVHRGERSDNQGRVSQFEYESPSEFVLPCPSCGHEVRGVSHLQTLYKCPACGTEFLAVGGVHSTADEETLNALRIRNVSLLRRSVFRTRSHFIVGASACIVALSEVVLIMLRGFRTRAWLTEITCIAAGFGLIILLKHCVARIVALGRELRDSKMQLPNEPQDFSNLSDGSQRIRDLENLGGGNSTVSE
jgi:hypothetical protein